MANSMLAILSFLFLSFLPPSHAFSWSFVHAPQQCGNLSIVVNGTDGIPPYRVLIIPFGPTPLANAVEARRIMDVAFPGTANKVEFMLKYPENSQFVAVVGIACLFLLFFVLFRGLLLFGDGFVVDEDIFAACAARCYPP
jgi:hypothetical protein